MILRTHLRKILHPVKVWPAEEAYRMWAPTYDKTENNAVLFAEERIMCSLLDRIDLADKSVVDVGCGTGRHVSHLLRRGAASVTGIDASMEMLSQASPKFDSL